MNIPNRFVVFDDRKALFVLFAKRLEQRSDGETFIHGVTEDTGRQCSANVTMGEVAIDTDSGVAVFRGLAVLPLSSVPCVDVTMDQADVMDYLSKRGFHPLKRSALRLRMALFVASVGLHIRRLPNALRAFWQVFWLGYIPLAPNTKQHYFAASRFPDDTSSL